MTKRKISKLKISNILGIGEIEISPGQIVEISGYNGSGKTSMLEAIQSIVSGGHDATLLRKGEEKGSVVLELDDGVVITKSVTASGTKLDVRDSDGKKLPRAATVIAQLLDALSVNPVEFIRARKQDRAKIMLETMPLSIDVEEIKKRAGYPITLRSPENSIDIVDEAIKIIYDERTGTNRAVKEKENTINQIKLALPDIPAGAASATADGEAELRAKIQSIDTQLNAELKRISDKKEMLKHEVENKKKNLREELQKQIDELKESFSKRAAELDSGLSKQMENAATREIQVVNTANAGKQEPTNALNMIVNNRELFSKREANLLVIKTMEEEVVGLKSDSKKQSDSISDLEAYKGELLDSMPIPGLTVKDGEIYLDDIPFDRLNTQKQTELAIDIALLRTGKLGIMCVDGLELMDSERFDKLMSYLEGKEIQAFVSRVSDHDLEVSNLAE